MNIIELQQFCHFLRLVFWPSTLLAAQATTSRTAAADKSWLARCRRQAYTPSSPPPPTTKENQRGALVGSRNCTWRSV